MCAPQRYSDILIVVEGEPVFLSELGFKLAAIGGFALVPLRAAGAELMLQGFDGGIESCCALANPPTEFRNDRRAGVAIW